jgi:uncharacterized protein
MIELRPHHLLCIFGWRGHGYTPDFTDNFNLVVERLRGEPFRLVLGPDSICRRCPSLNGDANGREFVQFEESTGDCVGVIDGRVLDRLPLVEGRTYRLAAVGVLIRDLIKPADLTFICAGCSWLGLGWCAAGLADRDLP